MGESGEDNINLDKTLNLSLIDVCFEDDCLYNSPPSEPLFSDDQTERKAVQFSMDVQTLGDFREGEGDRQSAQPLEPENTSRNVKYNLRKSLAWDSAFFTSDGVLEPDELSSMIGESEKGERKHILPGILEDVHRSTDSISTLATDSSTLGTLEDDLFGDIRASIQRSSKAPNTQVGQIKLGSGVHENKTTKSSEKMDILSENKSKTKAAIKKPGSGKMANQVSLSSQASKSASKNGEAISSLCKPPKIVGRPSAVLATAAATKRASLGLGAKHVKVEKGDAKNSADHLDNPKSLTVLPRGAKVPATGGSRNTVPKPVLPVKSSLRSSVAMKKQPTTSSSIDSLESLSSDSSSNRSLNIVKRKIDPKTSSTGPTVKTALRTTPRNKNQSTSTRNSPYLKSVTKLSSSISPASSVSEWSLESSSPTSTLNKRSNNSRPTLDNSDASKVLESQNNSSNKCTTGHGTQVTGLPSECVKRVSTGSGTLVHPDSMKPSGLRMPSPKIGFFDGVRSTVRTPSGSSHSHPTVSNDLPRFGTANVIPSGGSNNAKLGKLQPGRTAVVPGTKIGPEQLGSGFQSKSPRNGKNRSGIALKVQNRKSPNLKAEKTAPKEFNAAINNPDFGYVETNDSLCKDKWSPQSKGNDTVKNSELILNNGGSSATCKSSSMSEVENITLLQIVPEDAICGQKNNLNSLSNLNEEGKTCVEDQVDGLAQQIGPLDIHREIQQKPIGDCLSLDQVNESTGVNNNVLEEFVNLPISAPSVTVIEGVKVAETDKSYSSQADSEHQQVS